MSDAPFLIYGANGYTGELIARAAAARGARPILAGRTAASIARVASELGLAHRIFGLDDPAGIDAGLEGARVVLHCAGPFAHTFAPMVDACLRRRVSYLDITGEADVFEALAHKDAEARAASIMLLPGAGFDVVPSDCLAAHLKRRLPSATHLTLGFQAFGRVSRGTAATMVENAHRGGLIRQEGHLLHVPAAWRTRRIDFGEGAVLAVTIPWGDLSTAFHSTGIPNIEVYAAVPFPMRLGMRATRVISPLLALGSVQKWLKARVHDRPPGPSEEERRLGRSILWGEASDGAQTVVSRLRTPEAYTFTVLSALAIVERVLSGDSPVGFQTPSRAYGPDFVLSIESVSRQDEA